VVFVLDFKFAYGMLSMYSPKHSLLNCGSVTVSNE
jgi:hypothetical protein